MEGTVNDPLGTHAAIIDVSRLTRWNTTESPEYDIIIDDPLRQRQSPFKYNETVNSKIVLWSVSNFC